MLSKTTIQEIEKAMSLQKEVLDMYEELSNKNDLTERQTGMLIAIEHLKQFIDWKENDNDRTL